MIPAPAFDVEGDGSFIPNGWDWVMSDGAIIVDERNPHWLVPSLGGIAERLSEAWDKGVGPLSGSLLQQPARAMSLIRIWKTAWNACDCRRWDEEHRKKGGGDGG